MAYNENNFWVPNTYEEIVLIYLETYNKLLSEYLKSNLFLADHDLL